MRSVLFIDNDAKFLAAITTLFETRSQENSKSPGLIVHRADHAEAGLALLEANAVDLVVIGLILPDMTGLDLVRRIRRKYMRMQQLILSGPDSDEEAAQCMDERDLLVLDRPRSREEAATLYDIVDAMLDQRASANPAANLRADTVREAVHRLCLQGASAVVSVSQPQGPTGRIFVRSGSIIHSELADKDGAAACSQLLTLPQSSFTVSAYQEPPQTTMKPGSWEYLFDVAQAQGTTTERPAAPAASGRPDAPPGMSRPDAPPAPAAAAASAASASDEPRPLQPSSPLPDDGSPVISMDPGVLDQKPPAAAEAPATKLGWPAWIEQLVLCSNQGLLLDSAQSEGDSQAIVQFIQFVSLKLDPLVNELDLGPLEELNVQGEKLRAVVQFAGRLRGFARTSDAAIPGEMISAVLAALLHKQQQHQQPEVASA